jgi:hypothetical protein
MKSTNILARHAVFETNSSSCHSLAVLKDENYSQVSQTADLCQVKLDDDGKAYVELFLPTYLYRRQMAFRTAEEKLAYILAVESNPVIVSKVLKDFFDLHMVDYLVLNKERLATANQHNRLSVLDDAIQSLIINSNHYEQFVSSIIDTFNIRSAENIMADKFVKHIDGRLFRYCDDDYDNKKTVESGQFEMVNMDDMITDIIYLSKYTIHTGSDEADFSYSLKGLDEFQKSLLIRIIDTLLEVVEPQGDKGSTSATLPKFIQDDFGTKYYLPKNYQKVVRAKLLGLKHKVSNNKKLNYYLILKKLARIICWSDSKNNGNLYLLESKNLKYREWTSYPILRKHLSSFRIGYLFCLSTSDILDESESEIVEQIIKDLVSGLLGFCYSTYVIYTDAVNGIWNLKTAKQQLTDLLKSKLRLSNHFVGVRDEYHKMIHEQEVVYLNDLDDDEKVDLKLSVEV